MGATHVQFSPLQRGEEQSKHVEWVFIIGAQFSPRIQDEVIVGVAAGSMIQEEMDQQGLQVLSIYFFEDFVSPSS